VRMLYVTAAMMIFANSGAFAGASLYSATLAQPLAEKKVLIANGNIWRCDASTCILVSTPSDAVSVRTCHALQRQVGALTAYVIDGKPYDADKLAKCNSNG